MSNWIASTEWECTAAGANGAPPLYLIVSQMGCKVTTIGEDGIEYVVDTQPGNYLPDPGPWGNARDEAPQS